MDDEFQQILSFCEIRFFEQKFFSGFKVQSAHGFSSAIFDS
jgi:hypothetical protein